MQNLVNVLNFAINNAASAVLNLVAESEKKAKILSALNDAFDTIQEIHAQDNQVADVKAVMDKPAANEAPTQDIDLVNPASIETPIIAQYIPQPSNNYVDDLEQQLHKLRTIELNNRIQELEKQLQEQRAKL